MSEPQSNDQPFEGWAILELMGHRRLAGRVSEQEFAGSSFVRLDVYAEGDAPIVTQLYSASAVYCLTPTSEDIARKLSTTSRPRPVSRYELGEPDEEVPWGES